MKLTVVFREKKFIVVISQNNIVNDLKEEILRVYTALFPDSCPLPTQSKIQTLTGCMLHDGYTVSSVLSDNDIITVHTDSNQDEAKTNSMSILPSDSPLFCPFCGVAPMGYHSPVFASNKGYVTTSLQRHSSPAHYGHFSSLLGTPTSMSLIHSPMSTRARNTSTQCPSPEWNSEDDTRLHSNTNREESNNTYSRPFELGNSDHCPSPSALSHQGLSTQTHEKKRINSLRSLQSSSLIQTAPDQLHGNTPTVLATTSPNDESLSSLDVTQPEIQKSASSDMKKKKKKKKKLRKDQANAKNISSKKGDTKKGSEVVHTSSSDSQTALTVNLKSSAGTNPARNPVIQPVVNTPGRKSKHVASVSATLRMKESIESPPSKMDIRKRKLPEKTESDPKKAKVVRMKKGMTEKQKSMTQNVELDGDDTSDWISTDDDESEAEKGHSSSKTKTTSSKPSGVTNKSKPHVSDESTSEWESDSEVEGTTSVQVATSNVSAKKLVDKNQTTSSPDSDEISNRETKVDAPKRAPKSRGRSKAEKKEKSNTPHSSVKSTGWNTCHTPQGGAENELSQESLSGSSTIQKSETKKKGLERKVVDITTSLSSDWSSDEEPAESHQPKPKQREKRVKQSKAGKTQKKEPVSMPENSQEQAVLTDTLPTESQDNKETSGLSSKGVQKVVSKDAESRPSLKNTKLSGTPRNGTTDNQNETGDSDTTTKGESRSVGGNETKDCTSAKPSGKEDTDSDNCKSQGDKTLETWNTVSSPPKGVYSLWDRQRLKLKKHQRSSNLHSTEEPITDSVNKDDLPSGNGVESGERERPGSLNGGMLKEPLRSDSNEILAPNSLSDEDITAEVLSQSDDAITTIKETQESRDCSRSPSPEIPFLNPEKHSEHHSSTHNQKLQDNVTLSNKPPSYSDKDRLRNEGGLPDRSSPHRSSGDSKADSTQRELTLDDCNKTGLCETTLVPSSQTDVSDEDMDRDSDSPGCSADAGMSKSSLRLPRIKSKSENSEQSPVETEMDETNVASESSQGKGKRKQKHKKRKRKNKTLTVVDQVHKEESLTVSPKKLTVETESQEMDNTEGHMTNIENDATDHTSEMSDVSELASQALGKKRKKRKKKQGLESTIPDQQLEVISEEASTAAAPVTGSDEPSPPQTTGENDCIGSNASSKVDALSSPNHSTKESTHGPQNDASSTTLSEKTEGKDKEGFLKPMTPKKGLIPKLSPASKMNKSGEDPLPLREQKKTNLLSIFSVTETELSSEESSCERVGASGSQVHRRHGKRPQTPSLLSSLGSSRRKTKPAKRVVPLSRGALLNSSSQRRFSSEVGMRMFLLTNSPTSSATRRAKLHSTPRSPKLSPSQQQQTERMSPALDDALKEASVEGDGGREPSLSELLADGSLWDS